MERKLAALTPIRLWALTLLPDYTIHSYGLTSTYLLNHPQYKIIKRAHTSLYGHYVIKYSSRIWTFVEKFKSFVVNMKVRRGKAP